MTAPPNAIKRIPTPRAGACEVSLRLAAALLPVGLVSLLAVLVLLVVAATPASAFKQVDSAFGTQSTIPALGGTFNSPAGVAVRQSTGQIYVYERNGRRVQRFSATGTFERAWGWDVVQDGGSGDDNVAPLDEFEICTVASECKEGVEGTGAGQFQGTTTPPGVAVDQSTGDVYVTDAGNRRLQKFDADGNFLRTWGKDVDPGNAGTGFEICVAPGQCQGNNDGTLAGEFRANASNVAVDAAGDVYVGEGSNRRIQKFAPNGTPLRTWGWDVVASGPGNVNSDNEVQQVTVNATGGSFTLTFDGQTTAPIQENAESNTVDIALENLSNVDNVDVAGTAGGPWTITFLGSLAGTNLPQMTANGATLTGPGASASVTTVAEGAVFEICVPANGDVCKGGASGLGLGQFQVGATLYLAADAANRIYASDPDAGRVQRFNADGTSPEIFGAADVPGPGASGPRQIAVDRTDGHVYVVVQQTVGSGTELRIKELAPDGALVEDGVHGQGQGITSILGIALHESTGRLYLSSTQTQHWVLVLDDDGGWPGGPEGMIGTATDVTEHGATLNATISSDSQATYRFEYSLNGVDWTPATDFQPVAVGEDVPVSETVDGLQAGSMYSFRVVTRSVFVGEATSAEQTFMTLSSGPNAVTGAAQSVTSRSAQIRARINPNNLPTTYYFQYGTSAGDYANWTSVPASEDADAGSGGAPELFIAQLGDLAANQTYHYRVVATNSEGTDTGADRSFTTRAAGPPCCDRVYEMVTPPDKSSRRGGQDAPQDSPLVAVPSADGESVLFSLRFGITDAGAGGALPHAFDPLLIRRSPGGWDGEAVNNIPPQDPSIAGLINPAGMSADLEVQAWQHNEWLFPTESSLGTKVFGDDGGFASSGWYDWLLDPANQQGSVAVSADFALFSDDNQRMVRWGGLGATYRGLLGPTVAEDPSNSQLPGDEGGDAIYRQTPPGSGPIDLVNECTGAGGTATLIPMVDDSGTPGDTSDDEIGTQACEVGAVTSPRGAGVGGGLGIGGTSLSFAPVHRAVSTDGERVFFLSPDPVENTAPASCGTATGPDTDCPPQLFVRQYDSNGEPTVRWISRSAVEGQDPALVGRGIGFEGASSDGRVVYFRTNAPLTPDDPNGVKSGGNVVAPPAGGITSGVASNDSWDLYRYELPGDTDVDPQGGTLTRISGGPDGAYDPNVLNATDAQAAAGGTLRFLSDDGSKAYFVTRGIIGDSSDPWNATAPDELTGPGGDHTAINSRNLYEFDATESGADRWTFVASLPYESASGPVDSCATHHAASGMPQSSIEEPIARLATNCVHGTPDGRAIVFETQGTLTADDEDGAGDIYLYESDTDRLTRVSAPPEGTTGYTCTDSDGGEPCNADLGRDVQLGSRETVGLNGAQNQNLAIEGNDVSVFFESRLALVPADVNGSRMDVYRWRNGEVSLISPGSSDDGAYFSGNTTDGEDVFFATSEPIDPREIDEDFDIYDARVGGGIPLPQPAPAPCSALSDQCQGPGGSGVDVAPQSDQAIPNGNAPAKTRITLAVAALSKKALRRAVRSGRIPVRVRTSSPGRVSVVASAFVRGAKGRRTVARRRLVFRKAGVRTVRLRLSSDARARLRADKKLRVRLSVSQTGARRQTAVFVLRRAGK